jgi:hypothetical protein
MQKLADALTTPGMRISEEEDSLFCCKSLESKWFYHDLPET